METAIFGSVTMASPHWELRKQLQRNLRLMKFNRFFELQKLLVTGDSCRVTSEHSDNTVRSTCNDVVIRQDRDTPNRDARHRDHLFDLSCGLRPNSNSTVFTTRDNITIREQFNTIDETFMPCQSLGDRTLHIPYFQSPIVGSTDESLFIRQQRQGSNDI
ncbi:hypothetical protein WICPIJ_001379 [Wickerhamomyces pijperi]|uniref:Uncharacterized protein n=1 Tax=Wickerhamomyces pijperi TaxID=599730 RepID=A0A9P8QDP6_WICPI|nr:hypothetical protein WICPIJ_001379 [Wickerhamomyces pijperi]